jgi:AcrR family transcriptional regulator/predicted DNA-binding transcriptional regulator AlpA
MKKYPQHMKMSELCARTKIPADTIRNYSRKGLLPKPIKTGKTMAYYTVDHIDRIRKIQALQKKGLSLETIRLKLNAIPQEVSVDSKPEVLFTSKRAVIIKAAVDLFREKGYETINIDDIVTRAGIGKNTFYQYFKNLEELFFECARHVFFDDSRSFFAAGNAYDGRERLWQRGKTFMHAHRQIIEMFNLARGAFMKESNRLGQKLEEDVMHNIIHSIEADLVAAAQKEKIEFKDLHMLAFLLMGAMEYCYYYVQIHPEADIDQIYTMSWDMLFNVNGHYTGPEVEELMTYPAAIAACSEKLLLSEIDENGLMKISELSEKSGIPISTIRYYILQSLLPAVLKTGKTRAYYSGTHLKALHLIRHKQLIEKKPLQVIREEMEKEFGLPSKTEKTGDLSGDKRDVILAVSADLFLKKGYIETSTSDIAHHAKISKETLYKHFRNKEDIFMSCADTIFRDIYHHVRNEIREEKDAALRLIKRGKAFFSVYPQWVSMMNLVRGLSVGANPTYREKFYQLMKLIVKPSIREIEILQHEGRMRSDIPSELAGFLLMGMTEYGAWLIHHEKYSEVTIMEALTAITYEGVIVEPS